LCNNEEIVKKNNNKKREDSKASYFDGEIEKFFEIFSIGVDEIYFLLFLRKVLRGRIDCIYLFL
jgi:hypothetical protein